MNTALTNKVTLYVPSTNTDAKTRGSVVFRTAGLFARLFGGFTITQGQGGWMSPTQGLVMEDVTLVSSHCYDSALDAGLPRVMAMAKGICKTMSQESVAVEVNGVLYFATQDVAPNRLAALTAA
jgi:hypothetical protein